MFDTDEEIAQKFERINVLLENVNWDKLQKEHPNTEVIPWDSVFNYRYEKNVIFWQL